jgi:DNA-binding NarL/FixJ family response regulator
MKNIRVMLVDDHNLVRAGIRSLMEGLSGVEIIAEADNGPTALELMGEYSPDIVLLDIAMPGMNGLEVTERASKLYPNLKVILLSMHANEEYVHHALKLGAAGYLLKDAGTAELEIAIRAVAQGEAYLSPAISRRVIDGYMQRTVGEPKVNGPDLSAINLSARQREILRLIAEGFTTKEIAQKLDIRVKTVETHRTHLMKELDIHDIAGLVRYAIKKGLVSA